MSEPKKMSFMDVKPVSLSWTLSNGEVATEGDPVGMYNKLGKALSDSNLDMLDPAFQDVIRRYFRFPTLAEAEAKKVSTMSADQALAALSELKEFVQGIDSVKKLIGGSQVAPA